LSPGSNEGRALAERDEGTSRAKGRELTILADVTEFDTFVITTTENETGGAVQEKRLDMVHFFLSLFVIENFNKASSLNSI
jgi:hypothetical protein